jgi:hypothetical protein
MGFTALPTQIALGTWDKYTVSYSQFSTAGTSNNFTLFTLPAKTLIHKVIIKPTTAFSGGAISAYTLSVGIAGTLAKYIAAFDVFQAVAATTFGASATDIAVTLESFSAGVAIKVAAVSTSANLSAATAGAADIYVLTSLLP